MFCHGLRLLGHFSIVNRLFVGWFLANVTRLEKVSEFCMSFTEPNLNIALCSFAPNKKPLLYQDNVTVLPYIIQPISD